MITRDDILDTLSKATAYDSMHTPTPSRILIDAWLEHFERHAPTVQPADLLAAVTEYHREPRDRMLQPADLSTVARVLRREALERSALDSPERLALEARADAKAEQAPLARRDQADEHHQRLARVIARFDESDPDDAKATSWLHALADSPMRVGCPWCKAAPGSPCVIPETRIVLTKTRAHPARVKAAEEARASA